MKIGFEEGIILFGLAVTVIAIGFSVNSLFIPCFTLLLTFIYLKIVDAEKEMRKIVKEEVKKLKEDTKAQFTIAGLFAVFLMLIITMKLMPNIVSICDNISKTLEDGGYSIAAFLIKLVPASIVISILSAIYFYARPIIMREE